MVKITSSHGRELLARALLDQGSELSFVCEPLVQILRLPRRNSSITLIGIGAQEATTTTRGVVRLAFRPHFNSTTRIEVDAHLLPRLTKRIPSEPVSPRNWSHLTNLELADPTFATPSRIDILLVADIYGCLLRDELRKGDDQAPVAQLTSLGWIVSGPTSAIPQSSTFKPLINLCTADQILHDAVHQFWSQKTVSPPVGGNFSESEKSWEIHFRETHFRDSTGRYTVRLLFMNGSPSFGDSRTNASRLLGSMHHRFKRDSNFRSLYIDFLQEYENLGHMERIKNQEINDCYFLPHHGVARESSTTTKLRVVFNGSQKSSQGLSLNDVLYAGPKVQQDLDAVLMQWRVHPYVFACDIEKMYRQVKLHPDDRKYQQILWSENAGLEPSVFQLTTVTYGVTCAPFLAIRTLLQLADDDGDHFPLGAEAVKKHMYVDDVLSGGDSIELAQKWAIQVDQLLMAGGFKLQKWASNESTVISSIENTRKLQSQKALGDDACLRALGLSWDSASDAFVFCFCNESITSVTSTKGSYTKRSILSVVARLFDPLGWLAPVIILAKIFLQSLWTTKLDWDDPLPAMLANQWQTIIEELCASVSFSIPRWLGTFQSSAIEIHGFSDASRSALSAVVYARVLEDDLTARVTLLTAKTKVAPLKPVTIPRLELSAATLLAQLVATFRQNLDFNDVPVHMWVDSSVALAWIRGHPSRWKEFVSNRVALIQELLPGCRWNHVAGSETPADIASRGLVPSELKKTRAWWQGPDWLTLPSSFWPCSAPSIPEEVNMEERGKPVLTTTLSPAHWNLIDRYSSLDYLLRITARIMRAVSLFRRTESCPPGSAQLTPPQIESALHFWIKQTQATHFSAEIRLLQRGQPLPKSSNLLRLTPFLNEGGLLCLGGRLENSSLHDGSKHPFILPRASTLTSLLIRQAHLRTLHGGAQLTLSTLRQQVWVIGGRAPVRSAILRCVICARQRGATLNQRMGQLPASRTIPTRPFLNSGVDYAGPFSLKLRRDRSATTYKGYLVVFICLTTSAVHLELASTYSTEGFLAAYKRFTGRRGICASLTSDCGTNFVGADKELKCLFSATSKEFAQLRSLLANDQTAWHFNPPAAPHFGGKWEAAVKSAKFHMRRVIGDALLTYEKFSSLLVQVECVLNSRPLCVLSEDPDDFSVLTPGHFLIGDALNTLPEPSLNHLSSSRLSQWQRIRHMLDHFWQRWSREYLQRQQPVSKWQNPNRQLHVGSVVLITDERYPPSKWPLARVVTVHPGSDDLIRVVTLKTATGTELRRPVAKLCLLPLAESTSSDAP